MIPKTNRSAKLVRRTSIALILTVAAALRFYHIGSQSLWADEGLTARILRLPIAEMLQRIRDWEQTPPLYYFLMKPYVAVFGATEATLRYPSALMGALSVFALYACLCRTFNTSAGLIAAMLLALSPYHIAYSQEARAYALFILLTILSCDLFLRVLAERSQKLDVLYILATTLLLYTHLYGIFIVGAQNLALLVAWVLDRRRSADVRNADDQLRARPPDLKHWLTLNLVVLILYSAFLKTIWIWVRSVQTGFWVKKVTLDDFSRAYEIYAGSVPLLIALLSLAVIGIWRTRNRAASTLWLGVAILPIVIPVIVSVLTNPTFSARYGMPASLGLFTLAAVGMASLSKPALQIPTALILGAITLLPTNVPDPKPQWREAAGYLQKNMRNGDYAAINRKGAAQTMYDYYVYRPDVRRIGFDGESLPVTQPLPDDKHVWLILYTSDFRPGVMISRGHWQVARQKQFREILILELYDFPQASTKTPPTY